MSNIYIVAAKRSPIGAYLGGLSSLSLVDLSSKVLTQTLHSAKIDPQIIDNLILGNVLATGNGQGPARQIAINSGFKQETPAYSLNMICGSGLKAVVNAYFAIKGEANHVVAVVGAESMSSAPYVVSGYKMRSGTKMGNLEIVDTMLKDALTDAFSHNHMGVTAENIVEKLNISREEQDVFAFNSHAKALKAIEENAFENEVVPIKVNEKLTITTDESPRANINLESLAKLKTIFKKDGTVTAGNSSSLNDGAAAVVIADEQSVQKHNLKQLARIVAVSEFGLDPQIMGLGPVGAIKKALQIANLTLNEIDVLELNEAFAAQSIGVLKSLSNEFKVPYAEITNKTNLHGGAIALGHPLGCSGTRVLVTLINILISHKKRYGLASLCIGGGMGIAIIVERVGD